MAAQRIIDDGILDSFVDELYSSCNSGIGKDIVDGKVGFRELEQYVMGIKDVQNA